MVAPVEPAADRPGEKSVKEITRALAAPFDHREVKFKPQLVKGNRAIAVAYVDARVIQDRLDEVLGVENWQDEYQLLPDNSVLCRLRLKLGKRWITKMDVGSPSEQPDGGDRLKAAFSDALKRAAVKFGVGRYLYRLPAQWVDYDPVKKQFAQTPKLPAVSSAERGARNSERKPLALPGAGTGDGSKVPRSALRVPSSRLPASGEELHRRLRDYDTELSRKGLCPIGALLAHVTQAGVKAGYSADLSSWEGEAIRLAAEEARKFRDSLRRPEAGHKAVA
ncbi:MAG TPA: Rad52/Rad22 family DNA repair protein [Gemmataceae bacterium]